MQVNRSVAKLRPEDIALIADTIIAAADECILPRFGKQLQIDHKEQVVGYKEIVTEADLAASDFMLDRLRGRWPGSYSEESSPEEKARSTKFDVLVQLDPIDGTNEFSDGMADGFAVHAAVLHRVGGKPYQPVAGFIYIPGEKKLWFTDELGQLHLQLDGVEQELPEVAPIDAVRGYVRKYRISDNLLKYYELLGERLDLPVEIVELGGSGSGFSALLEGRINVKFQNLNYSKEWDLSMAVPMILARGGFVTDVFGRQYEFNRQDPYNRAGYISSLSFRSDQILFGDMEQWLDKLV